VLDELRDRMAAYLATHRVCIVSTQGTASSSAVLARYHLVQDADGRQALQVDCLVPRWADVTYHLEQNPGLLVIVPDLQGDGLGWLQIRGAARPVLACDWTEWHAAETSDVRIEDRYLAMRVTPQRIDLVDERQGWGISETLDM
jgi:hypothetical protein